MLEAAFRDTLFVISDEMKLTLNDIRSALELAIETKNDKHLSMVSELLKTAKGAFEIIDFNASALLASEMLLNVDELLSRKAKSPQSSLEAISSGVVILPAFFHKTIESEGRENSVALLPVMQELRAARQAKPLSEDTLYLMDVKDDELSDKTVMLPQLNELSKKEDLCELIAKYRAVFQTSLLGWIKDPHGQKHLTRIAVILEKYEQASKEERSFKLWWVTGGLVESLLQKGLKSSPDLRRLFGQVDRAAKRILDHGESHFQENTDRSLINQLLYFIGRSTSNGERVSKIRQAFSMNESLPLDEKLETAQSNLSGPDTQVMVSLSSAIREDLDKVKDALDIFNRTGSKENIQIEQRFDSLKKIADTLNMLGLNELQARVLDQQRELTQLLERNEPITDNHLIGIAASLLQVESRLEEELDKLAGKQDKDKPKYLLEALEATFRETKVNIARVKEVISQFMRDPTDLKPISRAPVLLKEARAATMLAEKERLAVVLERLQDYITRFLIGSGRLPYSEHLELLAGAIESVDFYLETLNKGRRDPWYMLDNADSCLEQLLREAPIQLLPKEHDGPVGENTVSLPTSDELLTVSKSGSGTVAVPQLTPEAIESMTQKTTQNLVEADDEHPDAYPVMDQSLETDPEVIEIFLEEANEVHANLAQEFSVWKADHEMREALVSVRRGFHTLKGSGRMVGARRMSEMAWQAEHLINRVLEGTIKIDDDGMHLIDRSVSCIPGLIEQLETGADTKEDAHQLMLSLESYISQKLGEQAEAGDSTLLPNQVEINAGVLQVSSQNSDAQKPHTQIIDMRGLMDPAEVAGNTQIMDMRRVINPNDQSAMSELLGADIEDSQDLGITAEQNAEKVYQLEKPLYDIYTEESAKHIATIRDFCSKSLDKSISNAMHRAVHTLHGSANMADLDPITQIAGELEHYVQRLYDEGLPLEENGANVIGDVTDSIEGMIATINQDTPMAFVDSELISKLHKLREQIDLQLEAKIQADQTSDDSFSSVELNEEGVELKEVDSLDADELLDELEVELEDILIVADTQTENSEMVEHQAPTMLAVDSEITNIFLEEASEIITETDAAVASWDSEGISDQKISELLRHLHTLKGGARMAGLLSLGDFTHELESFMLGLQNKSLEQSEGAKKTLQSAVDHMHSMLDEVKRGEPPTPAPHILSLMHDLVQGKEAEELSLLVEPEAQDTPEIVDDSIDELTEDSEEVSASMSAEEVAELEFTDEELSKTMPSITVIQPILDEAELNLDENSVTEDDGSIELVESNIEQDESIELEASHEEATQTEESVVQASEEPGAQEISVPSVTALTDEPLATESIFEYVSEVQDVQQRQQDAARISTSNLEVLLNQAGEVSIFRSRIEQELSNANLNLAELARTVNRVKDQLRKMEIETEATILYQHRDESENNDFDPLEMDQYSNVQQISRALAESVNDLQSLETSLENQFRDTEALLLQQSRVMTDLQDNLMRVRMIPFARYAPRYARIVRQIANETSKKVDLNVQGAESEIDRQVIERMQAPLEHMIRNSVIHGIESPEDRVAAGKDPEGVIQLRLSREGAQLILELEDDGAGLDYSRIREKALSIGMLNADQKATDADLAQLILAAGFSTASEVTQSAGRGVGMDVVASEVKQLGGSLQIISEPGKFTRFSMRLPFTRAINHALLVRAGEENYAVPIHKVDGVAKMSLANVQHLLSQENPVYEYANQEYSVKNLAQLLGSPNFAFDPDEQELSVIMVTGGDHHAALVVSELIGSREMVIKPVGPQIAGIRGISGATILGDGRIVIILDIDALLGVKLQDIAIAENIVTRETLPLILVVDDSITVRRVTERLLERNKMEVLTARDGLDALNVLQEHLPDLILLDIEMPRMDGYELAEHVRQDPRISEVPIIMITSRTGDKHRNRAIEIGVDDYLGKPYREDQLLEAIQPHLNK